METITVEIPRYIKLDKVAYFGEEVTLRFDMYALSDEIEPLLRKALPVTFRTLGKAVSIPDPIIRIRKLGSKQIERRTVWHEAYMAMREMTDDVHQIFEALVKRFESDDGFDEWIRELIARADALPDKPEPNRE